jgi:hypothetical protein
MSATVQPDQLLLSRDIYSDLMKAPDAAEAEGVLLSDPWNLPLRARLLLFYSWRGERKISDEIYSQRLKHIHWFIQNIPDSKFCGERFCYLLDKQPGYEGLKELWLSKIAESENLMRRVNAYLLFEAEGDSNLEKYFQKFFTGHENNLWVKALEQLGRDQQTWLNESISLEVAKPVASREIALALTTLANEKQWGRIAIEQYCSASRSDFEQAMILLSEHPHFNSLALIAGYSLPRYSLFSNIGLDPEVLSVRLVLASWLLRNVPGSLLTRNPVFMAPFLFGEEPPRMPSAAIKFLSDLWGAQIESNPDNSLVVRNAKYFQRHLSYAYTGFAKGISTALRKTGVNRR